MKIMNRIFNKNLSQRGGMMTEMLLMLALCAIILPFIINFQKSRIERAENILVAQEMESVQTALERYIELHRRELLAPVGRNITRVRITDLEDYGVPYEYIERHGDNFQIRILKSQNRQGHATLQGIVVLNDNEITPMRTREIINLGNDNMGFVDEGQAFGAFGTWRTNTSDFGISSAGGLVETTRTMLDSEQYLWRIPSENSADATMLSPLNLSGHDIIGGKFMDSYAAQFEEILTAQNMVADKTTFQTRITIDKTFQTSDATVAGVLSSDSRTMNISGTLTLNDTAKFSSFTVDDLWVNNLNLSGLSIATVSDNQVATLKVNQAIDMIGGRVTAMLTTVGFDGTITPKLVIKSRLEDSTNPGYFWDATSSNATAKLSDASFAELNRMATIISSREAGSATQSGKAFGTVATNKNATAADFMNAIIDIQNKVRTKYYQLNLQ